MERWSMLMRRSFSELKQGTYCCCWKMQVHSDTTNTSQRGYKEPDDSPSLRRMRQGQPDIPQTKHVMLW